MVDYHNVPNGLGPKIPIPLHKILKTKGGVENQLEYLKASNVARADTLHLLTVYSTPAESFSFAWNKDDICSLLGDRTRHLVVGALDAGGEAEDETWKSGCCEIIENCFYLMQPPFGNKEPFWLGKVRKRVLDQGVRMAHVQWWEPKKDQQKLPLHERDYFGCAYTPRTSSAAPISTLDKLDLTEGFTIQLNVKVSKAENVAYITPGRNKCNFDNIKWYLERWAPESNMHMEEDEKIPEHLMVQGRIDTPAPRVRKPRSKIPKPAVTPAKKAGKESPAEGAMAPAEKGLVTPATKAVRKSRAPPNVPKGGGSKKSRKK